MLAVASLIVIAAFRLAWGWEARADIATIQVDGKTVRSLALDDPQRVAISGRLGDSLIEVNNGRVRVLDSPGRRKLCIRHGWLSQPGETVVCLPNRVVVRIGGRPALDAMNH